MTKRYVFTPRRTGTPRRNGFTMRRNRRWLSPMLLLPAALVGSAVLLSVLLSGGSGAPCSGNACEALVAGDEGAAVAAAVASPTPRRSPRLGVEPVPKVTGLAASVIEEPCGATLYGLNERMHLPPASLTKIAAALAAVHHRDLSDIADITVNGPALSDETDSTIMGLEPGMRLSLHDLLYGLLLPSGNDAAIAIAQFVAGDEPAFVALMNEETANMGLRDSRFENPHGLDAPRHYTSAYDIATLGAALLREPALAEIVRTKTYQPAWDGPALQNLNLMLGNYHGVIGVKTGYTDLAGQTIVAAAERDGRRIIVSVLKSEDLYVDSAALLDWAFNETNPACEVTEAQAASVGR